MKSEDANIPNSPAYLSVTLCTLQVPLSLEALKLSTPKPNNKFENDIFLKASIIIDNR